MSESFFDETNVVLQFICRRLEIRTVLGYTDFQIGAVEQHRRVGINLRGCGPIVDHFHGEIKLGLDG